MRKTKRGQTILEYPMGNQQLQSLWNFKTGQTYKDRDVRAHSHFGAAFCGESTFIEIFGEGG